MQKALKIIRQEHRRFAAVLHCLENVIRDIDERGEAPDFPLLRALLDYIEGFLDRMHHPKEDLYLFPALRRRKGDEVAELLGRLETQHNRGYALIRRLRLRLEEYERAGPGAFGAFRDAALAYAAYEHDHISLEESQVLPLAKQCFTDEDWQPIEAAFAEHDDPMFGDAPRKEFAELFKMIANSAPAPYGLGERNTS